MGVKSSASFRLRELSEDEALKCLWPRMLNKPVSVFMHLYSYCCSIGEPLAFDVRPTLAIIRLIRGSGALCWEPACH